MTQNPEVYPDPHSFLPERFMGNDPAPDPREFIFGFGRRLCPGKPFIETTIWLAVASMTATLHISKSLDTDGNEISPLCEFTSGFVR
jgi:cytochrome P450